MKTPRKTLLIGLIATAPAAGGCAQDKAPARPPLPVTVWKVSSSQGADGSRYSANIVPDVQVDLAFKVGGYVEDILEVSAPDNPRHRVQEGDFVHKGTVLARVRDTEYRDRVTEAQAALTRAKADFNRATRLFENQSISKADYDASHASLTGAQARYDQAVPTVEDCRLVAPMDGWLLRRSIEIGSLASPGVSAFLLADTRVVKAVFGVPDVVVGEMHIGDPQQVTTDAIPGAVLHGRIARISPSADPNSRVFDVECSIPNPGNRLRAGMIATLTQAAIPLAPSGITIPISTVVRPRGDPQGYAVFVVVPDGARTVAHERRVVLGDVVGNTVTALEGLGDGDVVVVRGATLAADGGEVRIIP